jgi:hypothetical protein
MKIFYALIMLCQLGFMGATYAVEPIIPLSY